MLVNGRRIEVLEDGREGPAAVLLHSAGMASGQWRRLVGRLAPGFRVRAPDLLGYGQSDPWPETEEFSYEQDVAVVTEVARAAGGPVHLVGHSYGGFLALQAARSGAFPVASLALYDPVAFGVLRSTGDREGLADLDRTDDEGDFFAPELEGTEAWCRRFVDFWGGKGSWERLGAPTRAPFLRSARKIFQEVRSLVRDATPHTAYGSIEAPVLLLTGDQTPVAEQRVVRRLAEALPRPTLITLEQTGHMGPLTQMSRVNELIAAHMEGARR
jgi:pimeloyl-ACP methyl ester carboxylesterase